MLLLDIGDSRTQNDLMMTAINIDLAYRNQFRIQTFPVVRSLVSNANSVVPLGPRPTSQIDVWIESPGLTGEVNLTP